MRKPLRLLAIAAALVAVVAFPSVASAQNSHFNDGQGQFCNYDGTNADDDLQSESVFCSGVFSGNGNEGDLAFVVIVARAGCSVQNPGNEDIPGQRRFTSDAFPGDNGSTPYTVDGTITCHGNSEAFIESPVNLELYICTSGEPTFDRKTGEQTNPDCTLQDTETGVPITA